MPYGISWQTDELDETLTIATRPQPAGFYVSAHSADPGNNGQTAGEVSSGGYARQQVTSGQWSESVVGTNRRKATNVDIVWATATADYAGGAAITYLGFWATSTGTAETNFIARHALSASKTVSNGQKLRIQAGNLTITHGGS